MHHGRISHICKKTEGIFMTNDEVTSVGRGAPATGSLKGGLDTGKGSPCSTWKAYNRLAAAGSRMP